MTEPFDWAGLWSEAADIRYDHGDPAAAAYLRTRIEAAFVPVSAAKALMDEKHKEAAEAKLWFTKAQEWRQIAARAEAAEAEVRRLDYSSIHTCHAECPRLPCAQRREIEALTAQLAEARQAEWAADAGWTEIPLYTHPAPPADLVELVEAFRGLIDDEPCRYDHHGYCQAHYVTSPCEMAAARTALAKYLAKHGGA